MINTLVVPFAVFVKKVHLLCNAISVNHVQIQALVLFTPELPGCTPIIVLSDGNDVINLNVKGLNTVHAEYVDLKKVSLGVKLHFKHEIFPRESRLHKKWNQTEHFAFVLAL